MRVLPSILCVALFLGMWALYDVIDLGRLSGLVAAVAVAVIGGVIATTVPYWNRVLAYAQREDSRELAEAI
jgi:amino acid permease